MISNKELLEYYMRGWSDELNGSSSVLPNNALITKAYSIGANHAVLGDDVRSFDCLNEEEILKIIRE